LYGASSHANPVLVMATADRLLPPWSAALRELRAADPESDGEDLSGNAAPTLPSSKSARRSWEPPDRLTQKWKRYFSWNANHGIRELGSAESVAVVEPVVVVPTFNALSGDSSSPRRIAERQIDVVCAGRVAGTIAIEESRTY